MRYPSRILIFGSLSVLAIGGLYFNSTTVVPEVLNPAYLLRQTDDTILFEVQPTQIQRRFREQTLSASTSISNLNRRLGARAVRSRLGHSGDIISPVECQSPLDDTFSDVKGKLGGRDYNPLSCFYAFSLMTKSSGRSVTGTTLESAGNIISGRWVELGRDIKDEADCKYSKEEQRNDKIKKWEIGLGWGVQKINWSQSIDPQFMSHSNDSTVNQNRISTNDYTNLSRETHCSGGLSYSDVKSNDLSNLCLNLKGVIDTKVTAPLSYDPSTLQFFDLSKGRMNLNFTTRVYVFCDKNKIEGCPLWLGSTLSGFTQDVNSLSFAAADPTRYRVWYKDITSSVSEIEMNSHSIHQIATNSISHLASFIDSLNISNSGIDLKVSEAEAEASKLPNKITSDLRFCGSNYYGETRFRRLRSTKSDEFIGKHFEHFSQNSIEKILSASSRVFVKSVIPSYSETYARAVNSRTPSAITDEGELSYNLKIYNDQYVKSSGISAGNTQQYEFITDVSNEGAASCLPLSRFSVEPFLDDFYSSLNFRSGVIFQQGFSRQMIQEKFSYLLETKNICDSFSTEAGIPCPFTVNRSNYLVMCPATYTTSGSRIITTPPTMEVDVEFTSFPYLLSRWDNGGISDTKTDISGSLFSGSSGWDLANGTHRGVYDASMIYPGIGLKNLLSPANSGVMRGNFHVRSKNSSGAVFEFAVGEFETTFDVMYRFARGQCNWKGLEVEDIKWNQLSILGVNKSPAFDAMIFTDPGLETWFNSFVTTPLIETKIREAVLKNFIQNYRMSLPYFCGGYIDSQVSDNGQSGILHLKNLINCPEFKDNQDCDETNDPNDPNNPDVDVPGWDFPGVGSGPFDP